MTYTDAPSVTHMYHNDELQYGQQSMHCPLTDYPSSGDRYASSNTHTLETPSTLYSSPSSHIHQHPLFTRADDGSIRPLEPHLLNCNQTIYQNPSSLTHFPHHYQDTRQYQGQVEGWPLPEASHSTLPQRNLPLSYGIPTAAPYPPPRLTPPIRPLHQKLVPAGTATNLSGQRPTLAGSLDPSTGIFYRTPEHPRLRTAQACEKCRTRKAKCSGEHPSCKRCITRGLVCEYAKEGRVRGPNKPKARLGGNPANSIDGLEADKDGFRQRTSSTHSTSSSTSVPELPPAVRQALAVADSKMTAHISPRHPTPIRRNTLSSAERGSERALNQMSHINPADRVYHGGLQTRLSMPVLASKLHGEGNIYDHYDRRGNATSSGRSNLQLECGSPTLALTTQHGLHLSQFQAYEINLDHHSNNFHSDAGNSLVSTPHFFDSHCANSGDNNEGPSTCFPTQASCGSPLTCESGTASSMGSPLTPGSSSSTDSSMHQTQPQYATEKLHESSSMPIDLNPHSLIPSNATSDPINPEPGFISGDQSPVRGQGPTVPYQSALEGQMC